MIFFRLLTYFNLINSVLLSIDTKIEYHQLFEYQYLQKQGVLENILLGKINIKAKFQEYQYLIKEFTCQTFYLINSNYDNFIKEVINYIKLCGFNDCEINNRIIIQCSTSKHITFKQFEDIFTKDCGLFFHTFENSTSKIKEQYESMAIDDAQIETFKDVNLSYLNSFYSLNRLNILNNNFFDMDLNIADNFCIHYNETIDNEDEKINIDENFKDDFDETNYLYDIDKVHQYDKYNDNFFISINKQSSINNTGLCMSNKRFKSSSNIDQVYENIVNEDNNFILPEENTKSINSFVLLWNAINKEKSNFNLLKNQHDLFLFKSEIESYKIFIQEISVNYCSKLDESFEILQYILSENKKNLDRIFQLLFKSFDAKIFSFLLDLKE